MRKLKARSPSSDGYVQASGRASRAERGPDHIDGRVRRNDWKIGATPCFQAALSWGSEGTNLSYTFSIVVSHPAEGKSGLHLLAAVFPHSARSAGSRSRISRFSARAARPTLADNKPLLPCSRTSGHRRCLAPPPFFSWPSPRETPVRKAPQETREQTRRMPRTARHVRPWPVKITLSVRPIFATRP